MKYLKRFNESSVDRIDISDIDELKEVFTDFVDDFGYQFKEMVIGDISNDREPFRKINYTMLTQVENYELAYSMVEDRTYGKYVFFAMRISFSEWNGGLGPVVILSNDVYSRILSMGYNCDVTTINNLSGETISAIKSGSTGKVIIFRIGKDSILKNNNIL